MAGRQYFNKSVLGVVFALSATSAHAQSTSPAATSAQPAAAAAPSVDNPGVSSTAAPATPTSEMELYQLYAEASKLHDAGKFEQAYERYMKIWTQKRGYDVAASMGDIDLRREHYALAATHFRFALDHIPVTQNKLYLATLQDGFEKARAKVAEARVTPHPSVPGLQISNGLTGERYAQPFYLAPGHHTLKIMAPGHQVVLQEVTATTAATIELDVYLTPLGEAALGRAPDRTVKRRHPEWVFPIGGAVTLGLGAVATWSFLDAKDKHDELQGLRIGPSECNSSGSARCRRADDLGDETESRLALGWGMAGGAVVAAGATVLVWWLWETDVPVDVAYERDNNELSVRWTHAF